MPQKDEFTKVFWIFREKHMTRKNKFSKRIAIKNGLFSAQKMTFKEIILRLTLLGLFVWSILADEEINYLPLTILLIGGITLWIVSEVGARVIIKLIDWGILLASSLCNKTERMKAKL